MTIVSFLVRIRKLLAAKSVVILLGGLERFIMIYIIRKGATLGSPFNLNTKHDLLNEEAFPSFVHKTKYPLQRSLRALLSL